MQDTKHTHFGNLKAGWNSWPSGDWKWLMWHWKFHMEHKMFGEKKKKKEAGGKYQGLWFLSQQFHGRSNLILKLLCHNGYANSFPWLDCWWIMNLGNHADWHFIIFPHLIAGFTHHIFFIHWDNSIFRWDFSAPSRVRTEVPWSMPGNLRH